MNAHQDSNIQRIEMCEFNNFDGVKIGKRLRATYQKLWESLVFGRFGGGGELIELRDMGSMNASDLILICYDEQLDGLLKLGRTLKADERGWCRIRNGVFERHGTPPYYDAEELGRALGSSGGSGQPYIMDGNRSNGNLVRLWWD